MKDLQDPGRILRKSAVSFGWLSLILTSGTIGLVITAVMVAINPEMHSFIAAWFCDGQLSYSSFDNSLRPGERSTVHVIYCTGAEGVRRDITFRVFVIGVPLFYGSIVAAVLMLLWRGWIRPRLRRIWSSVEVVSNRPARPSDTARRLEEAQALYESGTISKQEYDAIRARILAEV